MFVTNVIALDTLHENVLKEAADSAEVEDPAEETANATNVMAMVILLVNAGKSKTGVIDATVLATSREIASKILMGRPATIATKPDTSPVTVLNPTTTAEEEIPCATTATRVGTSHVIVRKDLVQRAVTVVEKLVTLVATVIRTTATKTVV